MTSPTLERISNLFTAQDLMTSAGQLKRGDSLEHAMQLFHEYDVVPYPKAGEIKGFFKREDSGMTPIETGLLLSDGTSVFKILMLLNQNRFYFVISANTIVGYIHFSDLNRPITKIPFFVLFQSIERELWERIQNRISEKDFPKLFKESEAKKFISKRMKIKKYNVDIGWLI
jgi:hypothetical protein